MTDCEHEPNPHRKIEFIGGPIDGYRSHLSDEAHERGFALVATSYPSAAGRYFAHYQLCAHGHAHFIGYGIAPLPGKRA